MAKAWKNNVLRAIADRETNMKAVSLAAGKGETFVRDMLERRGSPSLDSFIAVARVLDWSVGQLIGEELRLRTKPVRVVGLAGAGPDGSVVFGAPGDEDLGEAPVAPNASEDTVAVEVRGQSMRGIAEDGWFVYYDERRSPPSEDLLGEICVVWLSDGRVLIKKLIKGRRARHFDLESAAAPTIHDAKVEFVAPVTAIVPRRASRRAAKGVAA